MLVDKIQNCMITTLFIIIIIIIYFIFFLILDYFNIFLTITILN